MQVNVGKLRLQLLDEIDRLFPPREIFLRTNGRVRYLAISRRQQLAVAGASLVFVAWILFSSTGFLLGNLLLDQRDGQIRKTAAAYANLQTEILATRQEFAQLAEELGANQKFMLDLARQGRAGLPSAATDGLAALTPPATTETAAPDPALNDFQDLLADLTASNRLVELEMKSIRNTIAALGRERDQAVLAREAMSKRLRDTQIRLVATKDGNAELGERLADLRLRLGALQMAYTEGAATERAFQETVAGMTADLSRTEQDNGRLERTIGAMQRTLATIADDRIALRSARDELSAKVSLLETRLSSVQTSHQTIFQKLTERTRVGVEEIEKTVDMTGLNVDSLLEAAARKLHGSGGPFLESAHLRSSEERKLLASIERLDDEVDRWERLQVVLRTLPLTTPLDNYSIGSLFGGRKDPVNGRRSKHEGLDLKNDLGTPVMATAPGKVVYAGWMGDYGRLVEIDHGLGIRTRYGHLKSISVKVGETVDYRQEIGALGSSGRSTGPHVHYEVRVNGKPYDPMNFLEAGKYVFKG
ncbi:MAG: peptidoglycan DD-metalloendopeptidase family protein [Dongiaceae bacterium]